MSKIIALLVYHANCNFATVTVDCVVKVPTEFRKHKTTTFFL